MVNYQNGKIYKIESYNGPLIYIGSTTKQYLSQRMETHRSGYKLWKSKSKNFITSYDVFEQYGLDNCKISLLESYPCNSKDELMSREAYFIKNLECCNKTIPCRTSKEYYECNKDIISEQKKEYYELNKDIISEQKKEYYNLNKDKINKKTKEYYELNKDIKSKKIKEYYELNKHKINERRRKLTQIKKLSIVDNLV